MNRPISGLDDLDGEDNNYGFGTVTNKSYAEAYNEPAPRQ